VRRWSTVVAVVVLLAGVALEAAGQARPPVRSDTTRRDSLARRDTTDSLGRPLADSLRRRKVDFTFESPDSVMQALMQRTGFSVTRYQGENVRFRAADRVLNIEGDPSAVQRDSTLLVGDTILFNDSTQMVRARGDTIWLRDPSQGEDDIVALKRMTYDVRSRVGTVQDVTTTVESGERWVVHGGTAAFKGDTSAAGRSAFYARDGWITSCEETEPHYHFRAKEMKLVSKNVMVARPAILYIADVPVFWLPFVFQDMRSGRRSGLIPPRFGFSEILRNSPTYRRTIEDLGYYFVLNDYMDTEITMDWRSNARAGEGDPGWVRFNTLSRYSWRDRFIDGTIGASLNFLRDGSRNQSYSLAHSQRFSERTNVRASLNYVTNTRIQRNTTLNPFEATQTIQSNMNFHSGRGPFSFDIGGSQRQYLGREEVQRDFPSINVSSKPIEVTSWLTWTPSFNSTNSQTFDIDQVGDFGFRYITDDLGRVVDSTRVRRNTRSSTVSFGTPIQIAGFNIANTIRISDNLNDFPQLRIVQDVNDSTIKDERVFARTYKTNVDWDFSFNLPSFSQGRWNLAPNVSFQKVDGRGGLWVRSERTGNTFVSQGLRPSFGLGVSPTFYGFFGGVGPIERIRHSIQPQLSFSYAPEGDVSDAYLAAIGGVRSRYSSANRQSALSLGLSTVFEAKLRAPESEDASDSTALQGPAQQGQKIKLLSLNFTALSWDFERARVTKRTGLNNTSFGINARSDLIPGFDIGVDYSLFQGDPQNSDTAVFKPYRTGVRAQLSLDAKSGLGRAIGRMLGLSAEEEEAAPQSFQTGARTQDAARAGFGQGGNFVAGQPIAGSVNRAASLAVPQGEGWNVSLSYSSQRQRPPVGGLIKDLDPTHVCDIHKDLDPFLYERCVLEVNTTSTNPQYGTETTLGGTFFRVPPQSSLQGQMAFNITDKWAARWQTTYDFETGDFASHVVSLQREMHDWNAIFAFTQSPNGNFAFNFFIALKAQPDIKFNYDRRNYPRGYSGRRDQ
jgi:hypothetical protein